MNKESSRYQKSSSQNLSNDSLFAQVSRFSIKEQNNKEGVIKKCEIKKVELY